jgi:hypothetical protein
MADFTRSIGYSAEEVVRLAKVMAEELNQKAYEDGLTDGRNEGYERGWTEGFAAGKGEWSTFNPGLIPLPPVEEVNIEEAGGAHRLRDDILPGVLRH